MLVDDENCERCPYCGQTAVAEVFEAWADHNFMVDACCPAAHEVLCQSLTDTQIARPLFDRAGLPGLRRVGDTGTSLIADWQLRIRPVTWARARRFVEAHHRHCQKPPAGWRFGAAVWNGQTLVGVVIVGRPTARRIDHTAVVEVTRLCIDHSLPSPLYWNAASMLLGWSARDARRRGFKRVITYLREDEAATSLKAAGWAPEALSRGGTWDRSDRPRMSQNIVPKQRWARQLAA